MNKTSPGKQALSWLLAAAMSVSLLPVSAFAAEEATAAEREDQQEESAVPIVSEDTEEDNTENVEEADAEEYISLQTEDVPVPQSEEDRYYLMNIPYDKFYSAIGATDNSTDFDAITSATHKVANYGMAGGSYHAEQTAQIAEDGTITAVGKDNNAKFGGVTWPVKVSAGTDLSRLGGTEIPSDAARTVAAVGRGQTTVSYLYGYECLMEAEAYSYCQLDEEPEYYLELKDGAVFSNGSNRAVTKDAAATVNYSDRHCDVALQLDGVDDVADILVNAAVITASENGRNRIQVGLAHVHNIWRNTELGWNLDTFDILNGKTIESITYYCSVKDDNVDEGNNDAPAYENYIYQYILNNDPVILDVESEYILMNIPYDEFYRAIGTAADSTDFDAISSATNKVGNYGKSGGSFHSKQSAETNRETGEVTAVGGANGAKNEGVTWPVKIEGGSDVLAQLWKQGGKVITEDSSVTVATVGRGQTSSSKLVSYEALNEAPAYSYFFLDSAPDNYIALSLDNNGDLNFENSNSTVTSQGTANVTASYGTNWGDVQLGVEGVSDVEAALVNAVVISTTDGTQVPLVHLYNVWSANDIAWKAATVSGLDGKAIQSITYYCSVKDGTVGADNSDAPAYQNYVYQYTVGDLKIPSVYTGTVTAKFNSASEIALTGLPGDVRNPQAKVYHNAGGRPAVITYLTPLEVDPADQDIDPVNAEIKEGKIAISPSLVTVTNNKGESQTYGQPVEDTEYTVEISSDNWIINKATATYRNPDNAYILVNIPYAEFYKAIGAMENSTDFDAISSATNKVGNYGKSGGSFHSKQSAEINVAGEVTAVGGANGAKNEGVTWPVKIEGGADVLTKLEALGGKEIAAGASVTVATVGRGQTNSSKLVSYETLNEAPAYSYYFLNGAPDNYFTLSLNGGTLKWEDTNNTAAKKTGAAVSSSYGTNWGDIQLGVSGVDDVSDKLVNAVVITAADGSQKTVNAGLVHLYNVWSANDIAWKAATVKGLDGKTIQSITYYCSVKDETVDADNSEAPMYQNYIYQYAVNEKIPSVYTGTVTAKFNGTSEIAITGLPEDVQNPRAKVYHSTGGRPAVITYLTPLEVDPADQDIDPVNAEIVNGKIAISPTLKTVTNDKGESKTYGQPVDGTEYTVEISCDNWIINKTTAVYTKSSSNNSSNTGRPSNSRPSSSNNSNSNTNTKPVNDNTKPSNDTPAPETPSTPSVPSTPSAPSVSFTDVNSGAFYYDAVQWAVAQGITNGTGTSTFSPSAPCTRGQVVTFLWRAAGSPVSSGNSAFTDVQASDYYYNAVLWAVEQGITSGMGSNEFRPNDTCTRSQAVTFLYRYAGSPAVSGNSAFTDVAGGAYYANAVTWAVNNQITEGTSASTFGPNDICTRSHIVTFLYRNLAG